MPTRREVLTGSAAVAGAALLPTARPAPAVARSSTTTTGEPFQLGVASGDPLPDSVILWTRLLADSALPSRPIKVGGESPAGGRFRGVVGGGGGAALARPELGHSVHVDAGGLRPGYDYFYRFRALGETSPTGRTKTAPA